MNADRRSFWTHHEEHREPRRQNEIANLGQNFVFLRELRGKSSYILLANSPINQSTNCAFRPKIADLKKKLKFRQDCYQYFAPLKRPI